MKKGEKKFLVILVVLFIAYVATAFLAPRPIDWSVTFSHKDKNPFGAFILSERSADLFGRPFTVSNSTISELSDIGNLLILCDFADIAGADYRSLVDKLEYGSNVLIAANQFSGFLMDSLDFRAPFSFHVLNQTLFEAATSEIEVGATRYSYPFSLVSNYFELDNKKEWDITAYLEGNPIMISRRVGKGTLTLCSTPYIFTNFGLLFDENYRCAAQLLSVLPEEPTHFTLFYQLGKAESTTPLRYFLSQAPLRWSLYFGLFTILLFLIVSSRRTQRSIPLIEPHSNATVAYVKTLGALFHREGNHKKAARRLVNYFMRELKERYFIKIDYSEKFYAHLSAKSGVEISTVIQTFELILEVRDLPYIDEKKLIDLSNKIEQFK